MIVDSPGRRWYALVMTEIDYAKMQKIYPRQKATLTRAMKKWRETGDNSAVFRACENAVDAWNEIGAWPDDWSLWERSLNDTLPWDSPVRLADI